MLLSGLGLRQSGRIGCTAVSSRACVSRPLVRLRSPSLSPLARRQLPCGPILLSAALIRETRRTRLGIHAQFVLGIGYGAECGWERTGVLACVCMRARDWFSCTVFLLLKMDE